VIAKKMDKLIAEIKRNMELYAEVKDAPVGLAFKRDQTWTKLKGGSNIDALVRDGMFGVIGKRVARLIKELEELTLNAAADAVYKELETACPGMFVRKGR
jgi:translation elongation factor EF-4